MAKCDCKTCSLLEDMTDDPGDAVSIFQVESFTEEEIAAFYNIFRSFDPESEGRIPATQIAPVMLALGRHPTVEELIEFTKAIDKNEHDFVDFPEFLTIMSLKSDRAENEDNLRQAFKVFDEDGNGNVSAEEIRDTMNKLGEHLSKEEVNDMIRMTDYDGDGQVNYEEFVRVMFSR